MDEELKTPETEVKPEENEIIDSFEATVAPEPFFTPVASCEVVVPTLCDEQLKKEADQRSNRTNLVYALLGLFFSPFFGIGFIFSLIGFISSIRLIFKTKSTTIRWALTLSVIGLIINVAVFIMMLTYLQNNPYPAEEIAPEI